MEVRGGDTQHAVVYSTVEGVVGGAGPACDRGGVVVSYDH